MLSLKAFPRSTLKSGAERGFGSGRGAGPRRDAQWEADERPAPTPAPNYKLPRRELSEAPRQGHGPTGAARELRLRQLLPPRQQIQSWRITEWNKTQQCNKISRRLVHLKPEQPGLAQDTARPLRATSRLGARQGERGFEMTLGELSKGDSSSQGSREEEDSRVCEQGRAAGSVRSGEVKSNCAASTAAINLSVYSCIPPQLSLPRHTGICVCLHTALLSSGLLPKWSAG